MKRRFGRVMYAGASKSGNRGYLQIVGLQSAGGPDRCCTLRDRFRDVAELMGEAEHDVLACMAFDGSMRTKLHGTNPLERVNKEIRRRNNVVGIVPNREAVIPSRRRAHAGTE